MIKVLQTFGSSMKSHIRRKHKPTPTIHIVLALIAGSSLTIPTSVSAAVVWLTNGDRISGIVLVSEPEAVTLRTTHLGSVVIKRGAIADMCINASEGAGISGSICTQRTVTVDKDPKKGPGREEVQEATVPPPSSGGKGTDLPLSAPSIELTGRWSIGINMTDGNSDARSYYGDTELVARAKKQRLTVGGRYNRVENSGNPSLDYQSGHMKFDSFLNGKMYLHSNVTGIWDRFKDIRLKSSLGLGLGYQFLETAVTKLSFELSGSYVNEDHIVADDKEFTSSRWSLNAAHFLYEDLLELFHKQSGLVSLIDTADTSIQAQTGLRFRIYDGLVATAQLNHNWDNTPSPGLRRLDETYLLTFGHKF